MSECFLDSHSGVSDVITTAPHNYPPKSNKVKNTYAGATAKVTDRTILTPGHEVAKNSFAGDILDLIDQTRDDRR